MRKQLGTLNFEPRILFSTITDTFILQLNLMTEKYPMRVARIIMLFTAVFIFLLTSCKRAEQSNKEMAVEADTSSVPIATAIDEPDTESTEIPPERHEVIDYPDYDETINNPSHVFEPFAKLKAVAADFIYHKDSLRAIGSDAIEKREKAVYATIMDYKRDVESGKYFQGTGVALLDLPRTLGEKDSSSNFLPKQRSSFFTNDNFFFLGGAPFIQRLSVYDSLTQQEIIPKDANGKPEIYLRVTETENKYHLLKSIMHFKKPRLKINFGGPVNVYDGPPDEVKGIGSVIHNFINDIPVFFLMESGMVPGRLKYYQVPFVQQYACYSSYPHLVFSCQADIDPNQIVGIYIPYDDHVPTACSVSHPDKWSWSADLNNDTVPDIACVIGTYKGVESGVLEMLWFINLNGTWKIVDFGEVPSCT